MNAVATYILRGRASAILVILICWAVGLLLLPPINMLTGAVVGLVTLRKGALEGVIVTLVAGLILGVMASFSTWGNALSITFLVSVGFILLPVWLLAVLLRNTISLALVTTAAAAMGILGVVAVHVALGDTAAWWYAELNRLIKPAFQGGGAMGVGPEQFERGLRAMSSVMTGLMSAGMMVSALVSLFIARATQAMLYNPGGFKEEFFQLRLGSPLAIMTIVLLAVSIFTQGSTHRFVIDVLIVLGSVYLLQGTAIVHAIIAKTGRHIAWLVALYALLFIVPHAAALVAALGLTDRWVDFRARFGANPQT